MGKLNLKAWQEKINALFSEEEVRDSLVKFREEDIDKFELSLEEWTKTYKNNIGTMDLDTLTELFRYTVNLMRAHTTDKNNQSAVEENARQVRLMVKISNS